MRYARARCESEAQDFTYKVYVTDSLYNSVNSMKFTKRWTEMLPDAKPKETRPADEIALDIISRAGLVFAEDGDEDESI